MKIGGRRGYGVSSAVRKTKVSGFATLDAPISQRATLNTRRSPKRFSLRYTFLLAFRLYLLPSHGSGCQVPRLGFRIAIVFILGIRRHSRSFDDDDDEAQSERFVTAAVGDDG